MWNKIKKWVIRIWKGNDGLGIKYDWIDKISMILGGFMMGCGFVGIVINISSNSDYIGWVAMGLMGAMLIVVVWWKATEKRLKEILKDKRLC